GDRHGPARDRGPAGAHPEPVRPGRGDHRVQRRRPCPLAGRLRPGPAPGRGGRRPVLGAGPGRPHPQRTGGRCPATLTSGQCGRRYAAARHAAAGRRLLGCVRTVLGRRRREVRMNGRMALMSLTADVKDELARLRVDKMSARKAEVAATLRFAGGLHIISGRIVVEAELDTGVAARRLRQAIHEVYGHASEVIVVSGGALRRGNRYVVRVVTGGEALARQTGLLDSRGRPVRGLPPHVVNASVGDAVAAWRGAFLAHGSLTEPGRSSALEVTCPGPEAALALVGAARRLGVPAKAREVRGVDRVVIRDGDAISALLTRMGAHDAVIAWEERRIRREVRGTANRLANFDDANLRRSAQAAVAAGARVERAFELLGDDVPE